MKKSTIILFLLIVLATGNYAQQCLTGGCTTGFISQYPVGIQSNATTSWQLVNGGNNMNAGNYTLFSLTAGTTYQWSYCDAFGGVSTSWDAQLTLFDNSNLSTPLCFSTDVCGINGNAPHISYTPSINMTARLLTTSYVSGVGGCQTNSGSPYNKLVWKKTAGATYNLTITVHNTSSALVNNAHVLLYDANWSSLDNDYTNSSGQASFSGLANGTYNYEVYFTPSGTNPPLSPVDEFWGSGTLSINNGNSSVSFTRVQPYISSAQGFSPSSVPAGTTSTGSFTVSNGLSYSTNSKVQVFVDLDQSNPWDYNSTSASQSITAGNTKTFAFNVTTSAMGAYKYYAFVYSLVNGSYIITDQYAWTTAFTATCPTLAMPTAPTPGSSVGPGTVLTTLTPSFSWGGTSSGIYHIQIWDAATNPADESNVIYGFHTSINSPGHCISGLSHQVPAGVLVNNGQYKWSVHRNDPCGVCESNPTIPLYFQIVTSSCPLSVAAVSNAPVATGGTLNLSATTIANATYSWSGPNGWTSTAQNPTRPNVTSNMAGNYCVTVTASGCSGVSACTNVAITNCPSTISASSNSPVATGGTLNLTATNIANATYSWSGPGGWISSTQNPSRSNFTAGMVGNYCVTVTASGCSGVSACTSVAITNCPSTVLASSNTPVATGGTLNLTATNIANATYSWSGPGGWTSSTQSPSRSNFTAGMAGSYCVTVTASGCSGISACTNVAITNCPTSVTAGSNSPVAEGEILDLSATSIAGAAYSWSGPAGWTSSLQNPSRPSVTIAMAGSYCVTATVSGCPVISNCTPIVISATPNTVPSTINSPLPSVNSSQGIFQSNLPNDLYTATIPMTTCIPRKECQEVFSQPSNPSNRTVGELVPKACDCFSSINNRWEFRQRGYITNNGGNDPCNTISQCASTTQANTPAVTHSQNSCWDKDDRYAWDTKLQGSLNSNGICVFAVEAGDVIYKGSSALYIKHPSNCVSDCWYSWYDNIVPTPGLTAVSKNQHIGHIKLLTDGHGHPLPSKSHLHFSVLYKDANNKLISANPQITPDYTNDLTGVDYTISNLQGTCAGSVLSGAKISFSKENEWFDAGLTDENGKFEVTTIPGLIDGDTIRVEANGYETLNILIDSINNGGEHLQIPLLKKTGNNGIIYPMVKIINNQPYFANPNIQISITGQNFTSYDILQAYSTEESVNYVPISLNNPSTSTIANVTLPDTGINNIAILFKGVDSVIILKELQFLPTANTYNIQVVSDSSALFSKIYLDGQYLKNITQLSENLSLQDRSHTLQFYKLGYLDSTITITSASAISLSLRSIPTATYSLSDSNIMDFAIHEKIQYYKNITAMDESMQNIISIKQFNDNFGGMGLTPKSRKFEIRHLNLSHSVIRIAAVLDQIESLSKDSIYLLNISDNGYQKYNFDSTSICDYDSAVQKLEFENINFNNGADQTQALVIMKRQPPVAVGGGLYLVEDVPLHISYNSFFSDPDSIHGDMTFSLVSADTSLMVQQVGDSLYITPAANFSGNATITLSATHDWLTKTITVAVNVTAVNDAPVISSVGNLSFCSNGAITINTSPAISDVDNLLSQISESISILSSSNANVSVNNLTYSQIQAHQFSFNSSQAEVSTFTVRIIANDGTDSSNAQIFNITVNMPPDVKAVASDTLLCYGESLTLTGIGATTYAWSNNAQDGVPVFPQSSVQYTVTGTDGNGCTATDEQLVLVFSLPPVTAQASNNAVCAGTSITLIGSGAGTYQWSGGVVDAVTFIPVSTLTYTVTGTDGNGCSATDAILVSVNALPVISILATDTIVCSNDHVTLTGAGAQNYAWSGSISNGMAFVPLQTQTYTLTGTDGNNCSSVATVQIIVNQLPQASISSATSTTFCEGDSVVLTSSAASGYLWSNGETIRSISVNASNQYTVTVTDLNGCTAAAAPIVITVNPLPLVSFSQLSDVLETMPTFAISGGNPPGGTYSGPGVIFGSFDPAIAGVGTHVVTYTYTDANGCTEKAQSTITVTKITSIDEIAGKTSLFVFPNPSNGTFTVQLITNGSKKAQITCLNLIGEQIYSQDYQIPGGRLSADLDLGTVAKGSYLLRVTIDGKSMYRKLLLTD